MHLIQVQHIMLSLTSWREIEQNWYKMSHNWLILVVLKFYLIMNFSRLNYSWTTRKLLVLSASQVWIQYISHWSLYWNKFQVNSPNWTLMWMSPKIPAWNFFVLTFFKAMIMLLQWKMMFLALQLSVIQKTFSSIAQFFKEFLIHLNH